MEVIVVEGKQRLEGEVVISGAKNAALALIPASLLINDICVIENLPNIDDMKCLVEILNDLGAKCELTQKNTIKIDSRNVDKYVADSDVVRKIRASYYLLGVLLGKFKKAYVALPGGCNFADRPIDQHIKGFEALGAKTSIEKGVIKLEAERLVGTTIYLDVVSVGATINIMLAAVYAEGVTIIENAAKEPHVVDTANFLNQMGAGIKGAGTDTIKITGVPVNSLKGNEYSVIPDQIEAGTYMALAAATRGDVTIRNIIPKHLESITAKLIEIGCNVTEGTDFIRVKVDSELKPTNVKTQVYPGFPTDMQPQMLALLSTIEGNSRVIETIYESRFQYVNELRKLGARVDLNKNSAIVKGSSDFQGASVTAFDLRAGAAMIIAGLCAEGKTKIANSHYIDRGYENLEEKMKNLGAVLYREEV